MLAATIELHLNNIILGYGSTFNTHMNSNIIVHNHIIFNNINLLYTTVNKVFTQLQMELS